MNSLSSIANKFKLSEKDVHKILLSHSNKTHTQLMKYENGYSVTQQTVLEIENSIQTLLEDIVPQEDVYSRASNKISFDLIPRLYFLLSKKVIVYIGMTHTLALRISTHAQTKEFDEVAAFKCGKGLRIKEIVNIMHYNPPLNRETLTKEQWFGLVLKQCCFEGEWEE